MNLAIAEKGLVVFDATVEGTPSHAAHPNTNNSIYNTIGINTTISVVIIAEKYIYILLFATYHSSSSPLYGAITSL